MFTWVYLFIHLLITFHLGGLHSYKVYHGKHESKNTNQKNYPVYNYPITVDKNGYDSKSDILSSQNNPYYYGNDRCLSTVSMFNKPVQNLPRHGKMINQWQNSTFDYTPLSTQEVLVGRAPYVQYAGFHSNQAAVRYQSSRNPLSESYTKKKPRMSTQV